jgi:hypothetical protein
VPHILIPGLDGRHTHKGHNISQGLVGLTCLSWVYVDIFLHRFVKCLNIVFGGEPAYFIGGSLLIW